MSKESEKIAREIIGEISRKTKVLSRGEYLECLDEIADHCAASIEAAELDETQAEDQE